MDGIKTASQVTNAGLDADLEYIWDIDVDIDSGKIECHPLKEEVEQTTKTVYGVRPPRFGNLVKNSTVFYVPGVNVSVSYNSVTCDASGAIVGKRSSSTMNRQTSSMNLLDFAHQNQTANVTLSNLNAASVPQIQILTPSHARKSSGTFKYPPPTVNEDETQMQSDMSIEHSPRSRACVYVWCSIESLSEMVISPYFLDFLEQTLFTVSSPQTPAEGNTVKGKYSHRKY